MIWLAAETRTEEFNTFYCFVCASSTYLSALSYVARVSCISSLAFACCYCRTSWGRPTLPEGFSSAPACWCSSSSIGAPIALAFPTKTHTQITKLIKYCHWIYIGIFLIKFIKILIWKNKKFFYFTSWNSINPHFHSITVQQNNRKRVEHLFRLKFKSKLADYKFLKNFCISILFYVFFLLLYFLYT